MNININFILAQLNFTAGDIQGNTQKILSACCADNIKNNTRPHSLVIFPELALSGYPPEDLLFREDFLEDIQSALIYIQANLPPDVGVIIGYPEKNKKNNNIYNSAIVMTREKILANYRKQRLPNYGVFDEKRYFKAGKKSCMFNYLGYNIGLLICEDLWFPAPLKKLSEKNPEIIISINASPFDVHKIQRRMDIMRLRVQETGLPLIYVNHCGAQDDLIFDGSSFVLDKTGQLLAQAEFAKEDLLLFKSNIKSNINSNAQIYKALVLSVKDYVHKNHFKKVLLGFSGGIDSALVLTIAVDALGKDNVLPVILPSRYTSALSLEAARQQLKNLDLNSRLICIDSLFDEFLRVLQLESASHNLTIENIQARIRAVLLMAISNETNALLLNTSNKSELAVGYGTLYGDMCGAYGVIKDLWKTRVYQIANYRNTLSAVIPQEIIERPPSAELAPGQLDTDTLPSYEILDQILEHYIEHEKSCEEITALGFDKILVNQIIRKVTLNEYKRKQSPPGGRVTPLAFTRERRYPVTSGFVLD